MGRQVAEDQARGQCQVSHRVNAMKSGSGKRMTRRMFFCRDAVSRVILVLQWLRGRATTCREELHDCFYVEKTWPAQARDRNVRLDEAGDAEIRKNGASHRIAVMRAIQSLAAPILQQGLNDAFAAEIERERSRTRFCAPFVGCSVYATRIKSFPKFSPRNSPIRARGAFSSP